MAEDTKLGARIVGIEYAVPASRVSNDELAKAHPHWNMPRVSLSTGVESRHWCDSDETALDLAVSATRRLFDRVGVSPSDIDAVLFCTHSPDYPLIANACLLQDRLGLPKGVAALDFTLACSGFIYGIYLAKALVESGAARSVLLVTAETYSKWLSAEDRATATLFGDGAAATLIAQGSSGIRGVAVGTDGAGFQKIFVPAGGARRKTSCETGLMKADEHGNQRSAEHLWMNGSALLDFVKTELPAFVNDYLRHSGTTVDDYDYVLLHQGSKLTVDYVYQALRIPHSKRLTNLANVGNTVSASLPILLRQAEVEGIIKPKMRLLLVGFGSGLSWGACDVEI